MKSRRQKSPVKDSRWRLPTPPKTPTLLGLDNSKLFFLVVFEPLNHLKPRRQVLKVDDFYQQRG